MKISELALYPLLSLTLVIFIYFLATRDNTPSLSQKSTIRVQPLQVNEKGRPGTDTGVDLVTAIQPEHPSLLRISMANQKTAAKEQYIFIPSERIYLAIELQNLQAGKHTLSAFWKRHDGKTVSFSSHDIVLQHFTSRRRTYFWLELMKNGVFTEMFTGKEYKDDAYGKWLVQVTLDGTVIANQPFEIRDL